MLTQRHKTLIWIALIVFVLELLAVPVFNYGLLTNFFQGSWLTFIIAAIGKMFLIVLYTMLISGSSFKSACVTYLGMVILFCIIIYMFVFALLQDNLVFGFTIFMIEIISLLLLVSYFSKSLTKGINKLN